jgi:hypothetical protein
MIKREERVGAIFTVSGVEEREGVRAKLDYSNPSQQHSLFAVGTPPALQRQNTEISKQIFPEKEYRGLSPNFHLHVSVSDLYTPTIGLTILLEEICRPILGLYKSLTGT